MQHILSMSVAARPPDLMRQCGAWTYGCQWLDAAMGSKPMVLWLGDEHTQNRFARLFDDMMWCDEHQLFTNDTFWYELHDILGLWSVPTWSPMDSARLRFWSPHFLRRHASTAAAAVGLCAGRDWSTTRLHRQQLFWLQLPTGSIAWQEWVLSKQTQTWM